MRIDLADLDAREFDVAIIGAGINGCSAAQALSAAGYTTLLVDRGDFAAGSSSRSTRLLHCGLRFLAPGGSPYDFLRHPARLRVATTMVRQAMAARAELVRTSAERLRKFRFGFPVYQGMQFRSWHVDLALRILQRLGPRDVPLERGRLSPALAASSPLFRYLRSPDELLGVNVFTEYQFDWPERVAMDMVLDAQRLGAVVRNYSPVTGLERVSDGQWRLTLQDALADRPPATVTAQMVLNLAGIWIDRVTRLANLQARRRVFFTKGAHIVIRLPQECRDVGVIGFNRDGVEPVYLVPWRDGLHYMGVTETVYEGDIDDVSATDEEIEWLLAEFNHLLPELALTIDDVLYSWAGVRPLTYDSRFPKGARSRVCHDLADDDMPNVLALTGGNVTSHRSAGAELCAAVRSRLAPSTNAQAPEFSPQRFEPELASPALLNHYPQLSIAELRHCAAHEQTTSLIDLLLRRTGVGWTETQGREGARRAAESVADILAWDGERIEREIAEFHAHLAHARRRPGNS